MKIKRLHSDAILPSGNQTSGFDLYACSDEEEIIIYPGQTERIPTGVAVDMRDPVCVGFIIGSATLAESFGIRVCSGIGYVDSRHQREIYVVLHNDTDKPYRLKHKMQIARLIILATRSVPLTIDESHV